MVQMHRGTDIRRSKDFDVQAIAVSITNDAEKGDHLALVVLDLVRIGVHQVPLSCSLTLGLRGRRRAKRDGNQTAVTLFGAPLEPLARAYSSSLRRNSSSSHTDKLRPFATFLNCATARL